MYAYPIVIHKDKDSDYGVTVPDLPGCFSAGDSLEEAISQAEEAIYCHLEGMALDGEPLPEPGAMDAHRKAHKGAVTWALIMIDLDKMSTSVERVNVTLPKVALSIIDQAVKVHGGNRSKFIAEAALERARKGAA